MGSLRELALFAGAGGGILGGHLLGWRTVCAVEWEPYPASVLAARQNDGVLPAFPIWDDIRTFDGRPWRGIIDVVSGGFPCQDISAAGKGAGLSGAKSGLWREMARVVGEVRPEFVFIENSPLLRTRGFEQVQEDLAKMGYECRWGVVGAHHVGAPHRRERIWIVANANHITGHSGGAKRKWRRALFTWCGIACKSQPIPRKWLNRFGDSCKTIERQDQKLPNSTFVGCDGCVQKQSFGVPLSEQEKLSVKRGCSGDSNNRELSTNDWPPEPDVGRMADGVAARVDRLKAIGNGQVPRVAAAAFRELNDDKYNQIKGAL